MFARAVAEAGREGPQQRGPHTLQQEQQHPQTVLSTQPPEASAPGPAREDQYFNPDKTHRLLNKYLLNYAEVNKIDHGML